MCLDIASGEYVGNHVALFNDSPKRAHYFFVLIISHACNLSNTPPLSLSPPATKYAELVMLGNLSMERQGRDSQSCAGLPTAAVGLSPSEAQRQVRELEWGVCECVTGELKWVCVWGCDCGTVALRGTEAGEKVGVGGVCECYCGPCECGGMC